jgi:hypothetical protein
MTTAPQNYEQAVAREEESRRLAHLGRARPLLGQPVVNLTWRHCEELALCQSPFLTKRPADRDDLFLFLWRLDPWFMRPDGTFPNLRPAEPRPGRIRLAFHRLALARFVARLDLRRAEVVVLEWIATAYQDMPAGPAKQEGQATSIFYPHLSWFDTICDYYTERGHDPERVLDFGVAWSLQMLRARLIAAGEWERCLDPSVELLKKMV